MAKILFAGDLHGSIYAATRVVDAAIEYDADVIIQAGDFGIWTHTMRGVAYLDELQDYLLSKDMTLYFVDGNHENFVDLYAIPTDPSGLRTVRPNIVHIPRGALLNIDGATIMGFGGAHSIDGPNGPSWWGQARGPVRDKDVIIDLGGWWVEERITQDQIDAVKEQQVDILVGHDCPLDVQIPNNYTTYPAGIQSRQRIGQVFDKVSPKVFVHGHYHVRYTSRLDDCRIIGLGDDKGSFNDLIYVLDTEEL